MPTRKRSHMESRALLMIINFKAKFPLTIKYNSHQAEPRLRNLSSRLLRTKTPRLAQETNQGYRLQPV